ncbi:MAG: VanZ family protein [Bacteroidia bacterium]|nr:VanZ family protein [Bacteroidia bacterium]NNK28231.1 VanZ family protein [Flavobacteriaceae bacterium]
MLKKYALLLAIGYTSAIGIASLVNLQDLPDIGISFIDKIFHFTAYAIMTILWFNYLSTRKDNNIHSIIWAVIISGVFGMIIEALQEALTANRQADVNDILANNAGILVTAFFLWFFYNKRVKKY